MLLVVAGGMGKRGNSLAARSMASGIGRAASGRLHCWVMSPDAAERWPGVLVEWRRHAQGWEGRCVYVVQDGGQTVVVEAWVQSAQLAPA